MRHWLRGALGAAVVYPLIWYYSEPSPEQPSAPSGPEGARPMASAASRAPAKPPIDEDQGQKRRMASRSVTERLPTSAASVREPELPRLPTVDDPKAALAVMPELRPVIARAAQVEQYAHNPGELDKQLQTLEEDPAKLAKLRAFAEMFVQLPPPRGDGYLPSSSGPPSSTAR